MQDLPALFLKQVKDQHLEISYFKIKTIRHID